MRIKKYENWKLSNSHHGGIFNINRQKVSQAFSISQLLETPKKSLNFQDEHQYIFTDPQVLNNSFNLNRRIFTKKDIQINQFIKLTNRTEREQTIKNKIKERIKEEFANQNFIESTRGFFSKQLPIYNLIATPQSKKPELNEGRVFIKGNSVAFKQIDKKNRSKSTLLRTSLPNFNLKSKLTKFEKFVIPDNNRPGKAKFHSVEIKRKNSSSLAERQKTVSYVKKKNSLKDIEPWQIDEGPQHFQM